METQQIHIKDGKKEYFIQPNDILFVKADGNYCDIYLTTQTVYNTVRIQIGQLWSMIEELKPTPENVQRVGRSHIVNLNYLQYADPQKRTITLFKDREVVLVNVSRDSIKALLQTLSRKRRKEVLTPYLVQMQLSVPVDELNDERLTENGHEYVDLGLPSGTLWSARSMGSNCVNGLYYGWGELYPCDSFSMKEYIHKDSKLEGMLRMRSADDVAHVNWGGNWRMPTEEEFEELARECIIMWCQTQQGQKGFLCTGPNGNRIFLEAGGYMKGVSPTPQNWKQDACLWTADASKSGAYGSKAYAYVFSECDGDAIGHSKIEGCYLGLTVRPVMSSPSKVQVKKDLKTLLVLDDFEDLLDSWDFTENDVLPNWRVAWPLLPRDPEEALRVLQKWCSKYKPDAIIGLGRAAIYAHQLPAKNILLFNPVFNPAEELDMEREDYEDDETTLAEIEMRIKCFTELAKHQFDQTVEKKDCCWAFFQDVCDDKNCEIFDEHFDNRKSFEMPVLQRKCYFECFYGPLVAIIDSEGDKFQGNPVVFNSPYAHKIFNLSSWDNED